MKKSNPGNKVLLLLLVIVPLFTPSCKKNIAGVTRPDADSATSMAQVFQDFWSGMNNNYVFWDIDTTNWDNIYHVFQDSFARLDINKPQDVLTSYRYFQEMTSGLVDGHYNINFYNPNLKNRSVNPAGARKHLHKAIASSFFYDSITKNYLTLSSKADTTFSNVEAGVTQNTYVQLVAGVIHPGIVYLHLNRFYLDQLVGPGNKFSTTWQFFLDKLHDTSIASKGVIVDVRGNPGGHIDDLVTICGQLINSPVNYAYVKQKSGNGRLDYTPWALASVAPVAGNPAMVLPIVVLTDQYSASMAEMTTMVLKTLPGTYIIGDTTWGANGPLTTNNSLFDGGQFSFGAFGYVYTSSQEYKYINGKIYESKGFPPDQYLPYDASAISSGKDPQLEAAIYKLTH